MRTLGNDLGTAALGVLTVIAFAVVIAFTWGSVVAPRSTRQITLGGAPETVGRTMPREAGTER